MDVRRFLQLPLQVYPNDPDWVAPTVAVRGARLLASGFADEGSQCRLVLAERDGALVGRCAVFRDSHHDRHAAENVVFFGYFECLDAESGRAVIAAVQDHARAWGAALLRGPRGFTRIDERGVLVGGHGAAPLLAGHHPRWYAQLFEQEEFERHHDALAYEIETLNPDGSERELPVTMSRRADACNLQGLEVRGVRWMRALSDIDVAHTVMVDAFRDVPDNTPLPRSTFRAVGVPFLAVTHRHMLQLARIDGEAAGFALCVPEMNEVLIRGRGSLSPCALIRMARGRHSMRTASFKLLGVLPAYRGTGLHAVLIREAIRGIRRAGYDRLEASLIDERNRPMRHIVESAGMRIYRRYRVYQQRLTPPAHPASAR